MLESFPHGLVLLRVEGARLRRWVALRLPVEARRWTWVRRAIAGHWELRRARGWSPSGAFAPRGPARWYAQKLCGGRCVDDADPSWRGIVLAAEDWPDEG